MASPPDEIGLLAGCDGSQTPYRFGARGSNTKPDGEILRPHVLGTINPPLRIKTRCGTLKPRATFSLEILAGRLLSAESHHATPPLRYSLPARHPLRPKQ
ncbi:hypothetical protein L1987_06498 [Smallanthus sonchifolius]|uniref:Uncharacterized protein n=1 Tax=Smallanthus sonchifolius TaxID=185202 RepID=A0ACB9JYH4_9ASTR|nr:hypothetical protein L1987_06498 [Smallanthus sonchifolius]